MEYTMNDYQGISTFDTYNYSDEVQFESIKLDLFSHGDNLYQKTRFGQIILVSKKPYQQPKKWSSNEIINLRNTNDFESMRINAEITDILQSRQLIFLEESDFSTSSQDIALIVNPLNEINLSLIESHKFSIEKVILHFSGPSNIDKNEINEYASKIKEILNLDFYPLIGLSINPKLRDELVSNFLFIKNEENK
jgi:hypothetical protein